MSDYSPNLGNPFRESEDAVLAEVVPSPPPNLWPAFVVVIAAIMGALVASGMVIGVAAVVTGNLQSLRNPGQQMTWLTDLASSPLGLIMLILPGQLAFAAAAMIAAAFSRERWSERLGFRAGHLPVWTWPLFLLGTPVIGMIAAQLLSRLVGKPSEQMKMLEQLFQFDSLGSLLLLLLLVSLVPGIVEEVLFRGYMQRRLLRRLPAASSIVICSVFFAAAHMDPMHAAGVFPLGVWLGVIAWRADSIWPAICGHIGNNAFAIVMAPLVGDNPDVLEMSPLVVPLVGLSLMAFIGSLLVLIFMGRRQSTSYPKPAGDWW